ncbi:hypothetical protein KR009_007360, partial [Drosophila setifemur]
MRVFVALVCCVGLVALASGQSLSIRGRPLRSSQIKLAVEPSPTLLVKNAAILPAVQLAADAQTPEIPIASVSAGKRRLMSPYMYPRYFPDYGVPSQGWYPGGDWNNGGWNSGIPRYWNNNNWFDYGYYPRRRLVKPVTTGSSSTNSDGVAEATPSVDATFSTAVLPDVV